MTSVVVAVEVDQTGSVAAAGGRGASPRVRGLPIEAPGHLNPHRHCALQPGSLRRRAKTM